MPKLKLTTVCLALMAALTLTVLSADARGERPRGGHAPVTTVIEQARPVGSSASGHASLTVTAVSQGESPQSPALAVAVVEGIAPVAPEILLTGGPLTPGPNILTINNGLSGALAVLISGTQPGRANLTVYGQQLTTAFADPVAIAFTRIGSVRALTLGRLSERGAGRDVGSSGPFVVSVTEAQLGQTMQFQAFQILPILAASPVLSVPVVGAP